MHWELHLEQAIGIWCQLNLTISQSLANKCQAMEVVWGDCYKTSNQDQFYDYRYVVPLSTFPWWFEHIWTCALWYLAYDSVLGPGSANFSVQNVQMRHSPEHGMTLTYSGFKIFILRLFRIIVMGCHGLLAKSIHVYKCLYYIYIYNLI